MKGGWAEDLAAKHLEAQGLEVLARNYRVRGGELDLIARFPTSGLLVFVEVKQRASDAFGTPLEAITPRKLGLLQRTALEYMVREWACDDAPCRFDAVLVSGTPEHHWLEWVQGLV